MQCKIFYFNVQMVMMHGPCLTAQKRQVQTPCLFNGILFSDIPALFTIVLGLPSPPLSFF